jgi:mRNA interferase HigB
MRVIAVWTLKAFWNSHLKYQGAEGPTLAWYRDVISSDWSKPSAVKAQFGNASILQGSRVVFNIGGNKNRIVVWINYPHRIVYIRFIGTHKRYDAIDAQTI